MPLHLVPDALKEAEQSPRLLKERSVSIACGDAGHESGLSCDQSVSRRKMTC